MNDTYPQAVFFLRNDRDAIDRLILLMFGARGRHHEWLARGAAGRSSPTLRYNKRRQVSAPP